MKKFLIYAPSYDTNSGGCIVLHKLCDCLNRLGYEAFIYPMIPSFELNVGNAHTAKTMLAQMIGAISRVENFKVNPSFLSPVLKPKFEDFASDDTVVVYPEVTFGNPLKAKNVVRWILYTPGELVPAVYYGFDELHFLFQEAFGRYEFPRCYTSKRPLTITSFPTELYFQELDSHERSGVAYCIRKSPREATPDLLLNGIRIDGKEHVEIAKIFKRVKTFISYDLYTAYSRFASIAGCDSIIMPLPNTKREDLFPDGDRLDGVAYGFDDLERSRSTRQRLLRKFVESEQQNMSTARAFAEEVHNFFER